MDEQWDIRDKVCLVTGANRGLGRDVAKQLIEEGAERVLLACRNIYYGQEVVEEISKHQHFSFGEAKRRLEVYELDLGSFESIRNCAALILKNEPKLNVLINNAGIMPPPRRMFTSNGFELGFGTNHLGHFLLTQLLMNLLKKSSPSRVIVVASTAYKITWLVGGFHLSDVNFDRDRYHFFLSYGHSKLANILFAREFQRRYEGSGVNCVAVHPGSIANHPPSNWFLRLLFWPFSLLLLTNEQGARRVTFCAITPALKLSKSCYIENCRVTEPWQIACDDKTAKDLWELSDRLISK